MATMPGKLPRNRKKHVKKTQATGRVVTICTIIRMMIAMNEGMTTVNPSMTIVATIETTTAKAGSRTTAMTGVGTAGGEAMMTTDAAGGAETIDGILEDEDEAINATQNQVDVRPGNQTIVWTLEKQTIAASPEVRTRATIGKTTEETTRVVTETTIARVLPNGIPAAVPPVIVTIAGTIRAGRTTAAGAARG